jgi:predicted small secreted protein
MMNMMKFEKTVSAAVILGALLVTLSACQKKEGPAEQAGKQIDQTTEKVGEQIEKTGDQIQDAAKGDKQ